MIEVVDLKKQFEDALILKGVSLKIPQGEIVGIIGPSGSGKSTLLRCMNFMEIPSEGRILIDGEVMTERNANTLRHKVGMVFQHFYLFPHMTILDNITYAPMKVLGKSRKSAEATAHALLVKVGLGEKSGAFPSSLSGGQKQRAAIARTLAMEPQVILFDEPTSALDPEMVKEVLEVIRSLAHTGITIALVSHEMGFVRDLADRILFLDGGQIVEDAEPEVFFNQPKSLRARQFLDKVL